MHVRFRSSIRTDTDLKERLGTFLALYGFARNLSFAAAVTGPFLLAGSRWNSGRTELLSYGILALLVAVSMWYRYLKFFRQYSYELFNVYGGS